MKTQTILKSIINGPIQIVIMLKEPQVTMEIICNLETAAIAMDQIFI